MLTELGLTPLLLPITYHLDRHEQYRIMENVCPTVTKEVATFALSFGSSPKILVTFSCQLPLQASDSPHY